jgi:hypothetical protein
LASFGHFLADLRLVAAPELPYDAAKENATIQMPAVTDAVQLEAALAWQRIRSSNSLC